MSRFILGIAIVLLMVAPMGYARDAYVMGMYARGDDVTGCSWLVWTGDVLFYNTSATEQHVRVVGVSNGTLDIFGRDAITVPPNSVVSQALTTGALWYPVGPGGVSPLWVWRLEVPDAVRVHSTMRLDEEFCTNSLTPESRGEISLPTFDKLVPANEQQVFLGTDAGELPRHVNVGLYNSGPMTSIAQVHLRRSCDNDVLAATAVAVPGNTTIQVQLQSGAAPAPCIAEVGTATGTYVTVTLDQPGLAFVSVLANETVTRLTHNFVK